MIVSYNAATIDCPDHTALAAFYAEILGWEVVYSDENAAYVAGEGGKLGFQKVEKYTKPEWPDGAIPQQVHLDLTAADLDEAEKALIKAGATKATEQPGGDYWRVFLDPAGHPFCVAPPME